MAKTISSMIVASLGFANAQHFSQQEFQQAHQQVQDLVAPIRRLQDGMPTIPTECKTACPTLEASMQDMMSMAPQDQGNSTTPDLSGMSEMMTAMCKHKSSFACVASNKEACGGMSMGELDNALEEMECLCDACPCMMHAYTSLMTMMMSMFGGGNQADPMAMVKQMCPLVEPLECVSTQSTCQKLNASMGAMASSMTSMKVICVAQKVPLRPAACDAVGSDATTTSGATMENNASYAADSAFPQLAAGLACLMPTAAALLEISA